MIGLAWRTVLWAVTSTVRVAVDPLGPVGRDPDLSRNDACALTASDATCSPPVPDFDEPPNFNPPNVGAASVGAGFGTLLVVVLVIALVGAIAWLVWAAIKQRGSESDDGEPDDFDEDLDDDSAGERIIDVERPPDRWRRAAGEHRDAGRFRDAVRCQYRALVGDLARAGIVDEIPGRTSGEERVQLAELAPDVSPTFAAAADIFDEAWFNDDEVTAADDERFLSAERVVLDHLLAGSGRHGSARNGSRR